MKRVLLSLMIVALPLVAQVAGKDDAAQSMVQRLFVLKYADPGQIRNLLRAFDTPMQTNPEMRSLAVTATPATMAAIEDAIKRLDVPSSAPQNLEIVAYFLVGRSDAGYGQVSDSAAELPSDLNDVVSQLKKAFAYKTYRLLEQVSLRTRTGKPAEASSAGAAVKLAGLSHPITTRLRIVVSTTREDDGTIRINGLAIEQKVPVETTDRKVVYQDLQMHTDLDIREGQKVVVGRNGINPQEAVFVVLTARVVQ